MARTGAHPPHSYTPLISALVGFVLMIGVLTGATGVVIAAGGMSLIALLRWMTVESSNHQARERLRLAREHADRFVLPDDLDYPCQRLLHRAQTAVDAVLGSHVQRAGLIDTIDNQVTLPEEVWQIAHRLSRLSAMHAEHRRLVPRDLPSGMQDAVKPYTTALDAAWTSLSKRVKRLEEYAKQVTRADRVYHAHRKLEALAARTPDYQRLVADIVRDELAHEHIKQLGDQAQQVRRLFEESIHQARRTAGELLRAPQT
jgi:hypothetical protein